MKGPGLRIDVDVRRAWRCPVCGQGQRLTMDITAPRCFCVRDGVPMKLAEGQRSGRLDLRPELRSMLDRIQAGEEFSRMTSPLTDDAEGASRSRNRPQRSDRSSGDAERPPRVPPPVELPAVVPAATIAPSTPPSVAAPAPRSPALPDEDDFGAGLGVGETPAPQ